MVVNKSIWHLLGGKEEEKENAKIVAGAVGEYGIKTFVNPCKNHKTCDILKWIKKRQK